MSLTDHGSYAAKRSGRNGWVGYTEGDETPRDAVLHASPPQVAQRVAEDRLRIVLSSADAESVFGGPVAVH